MIPGAPPLVAGSREMNGLRASLSEIVAQMHGAIRALLGEIYGEAGARLRIVYGGSVKPANARVVSQFEISATVFS
ncbi:MAG: triose-phosphate isomerase [Roseiarcus sp.]|jgi:triosephosphate isomerase